MTEGSGEELDARLFLTARTASILKAGGEGCQELVMRCTRQEWNKKLAPRVAS